MNYNAKGGGGVGPAPGRRWKWLVPALLWVAFGCAGATGGSPFDRTASQDEVVLRVENLNMNEASIYLLPGGRRTLLGSIGGRSVQFFQFGWPSPAPLRLEIELVVGDRYRPPPLPFTPGVRVELLIASELRRSILRQ